jgi:protein SCO1/2
LGRKEVIQKEVNGKMVSDTLYHTIGDFQFVDQDSMLVTPQSYKDKIYVADFFFTSCPTICPIMKTQMLRVYEAYKDNPDVMILSHTIDPEYDTVALLKDFALRLGIEGNEKWKFVTGDKDHIYEIGQTRYMVSATEDPSEPGGYVHSGAFILVDKEQRIRGIYDGTKEDQVDRLIKDIPRLLKTYEKNL